MENKGELNDNEKQEKAIELLKSNIELIKGGFKTVRTKEVLHEGEELQAQEEFSGALFLGKLEERVTTLIIEELEVDITGEPDFIIEIKENQGFQAWTVPKEADIDPEYAYLLVRHVDKQGAQTTEVLLYDYNIMEMFREFEGWEFPDLDNLNSSLEK